MGNLDIKLRTVELHQTNFLKPLSEESILSQKRRNQSRNQMLKSMYLI